MENNILIKKLGSVIRKLRQIKGYSQENLAERSSLHRTYIGSVERGERNPTFSSIDKILQALETDWHKFGLLIDNERSNRS